MAWIESHTVLMRHRKIQELSLTLNIKPVQALGHIHALWHTAMEQAEDGDLSKWTDEFIAGSAYWEGDPKTFVSALQLGFMDGRCIHDWWDYAGKYLTAKYRSSNPSKLKIIMEKCKSRSLVGLKSDCESDFSLLQRQEERKGNYCSSSSESEEKNKNNNNSSNSNGNAPSCDPGYLDAHLLQYVRDRYPEGDHGALLAKIQDKYKTDPDSTMESINRWFEKRAKEREKKEKQAEQEVFLKKRVHDAAELWEPLKGLPVHVRWPGGAQFEGMCMENEPVITRNLLGQRYPILTLLQDGAEIKRKAVE